MMMVSGQGIYLMVTGSVKYNNNVLIMGTPIKYLYILNLFDTK